MNTREFLELLLPDTGWLFTATQIPGGKGWINTPHQSFDAAIKHITKLTFEQKAAYFALASYGKDKVWDAEYVDPKTGEKVGKFRQRTQGNAMLLKSFFLDLDVDPTDDQKFPDKPTALADFEAFRARVGLSKPMIVDSGGGYHIYWPLHQPVPAKTWRGVADTFKNICLSEGFKADRSLTSDQARVLRALGGYNTRRDHAVQLVQQTTPIAFEEFESVLNDFVTSNGISIPRPSVGSSGLAPALGVNPSDIFSVAGGNLGATSDPINLDRIAFHCEQMGIQVGSRGAQTGEKLWRAALGIAKFAEPQDLAYRAVSDGHPEYDEGRTIIKIQNWHTGPTTCASFHQENPLACESCYHWEKLTSPAQLGRIIIQAPAPTVTIEDPTTGIVETIVVSEVPEKYKRRKDGAILFVSEDSNGGVEYIVISPYDFYPLSILRQNGGDAHVNERSLWRAHLPIIGVQDMEVEQSMIGDGRSLYKFLMSKGMYVDPEQAKGLQLYMSAYLQKLSAEANREKLYERMGWHADHSEFVLANHVIHRDGKMTKTQPSRTVRAVTKEGIAPRGTLDGWKQAMKFYIGDQYAGHRMFLYASFGAPLFHMNDTGNKGVVLSANGGSGRGKTTCLLACGSVWGEPNALILNGNKDGSTVNALYESLGAVHSLPFLWDDSTERDTDDMRRLFLNVSQGEGKVRMRDGQGLNDRRVQWETMMLNTSNVDDTARTMASGKEVDPHLMRLISVEFSLVRTDAAAKLLADNFIRAIKGNHGHAGPVFMQAVVANYGKVRDKYINNVSKVDRMINSANASAERFWSAAVAAAYTGASLAKHLGILPVEFDVEADLQWMVSHLQRQRQTITESRQTGLELFAEFLELHIGNTLVLSAKSSSNLDNIVSKPYNSLLIRHNADMEVMHVSRAALMEYCHETKASFKTIENELMQAGVITNKNSLKVLGADTPYAKGQTRCWQINTKLLGPAVPTAVAGVGTASNVTPITGSKAA